MWNSFCYNYTYFPCVFKKNLPKFIHETECELHEECKKIYDQFNVEYVSLSRVGFNKFVVVWRINYQKELI